MMKIIVCIKQVPGTNEVKTDPETNTIIRENVPAIINPFDTYAIEEAVRIKERTGAFIYGISMGIPLAEDMLKEAVSLGIDKGILMTDRKFAGADTLATAYTLSKGIERIGEFDLMVFVSGSVFTSLVPGTCFMQTIIFIIGPPHIQK
jgi:electron transfer flavoprotein beta subunit